jgi:hypothetical protein
MVQGIKLFDAQDGKSPTLGVTLFDQIVIDLAAAEQNSTNVRTVIGGIIEDLMKMTVREFLDLRHRTFMPQQTFGLHHDEGSTKVAMHLPAEQMEILCRCARVADLYIVLGTQLQETFGPRARVLSALPLVTVRQQQNQTAIALPFRLAAHEKLVDLDLSAIGEISELGFPEYERIRRIQRVAEFETENRCLRQRAVMNKEWRLPRIECIERAVLFRAFLIDEDSMPLTESAAFAVLAGEPDRDSLQEQRAEGEDFR